MPANYTIRADVIDILKDTPRNTDIFLVDSNVWYWISYTRASQGLIQPKRYQITDYPNYLKSALTNGSRIHWSGLSLAELSHLIEKNEREIYDMQLTQTIGGQVATCGVKEYRHNFPAERSRVVLEVQSAWAQVKSLAQPLSVTVDEPTTNAAITRFQTQKVDGYDLFILETMATTGILKVITDDGDFATIPDIQVFTANHNVLKSARNKHKILLR